MPATTRTILIAGATGKQGGSVISALLSQATTSSPPAQTFEILALTRDPTSSSSQKLAKKSSPTTTIKLVQGNLDNPSSIFSAAREATKNPVWGVFSVQAAIGSSTELEQGKGLVDAAKEAGVKFFVQASVDRGGDARSRQNPTSIPHFHKKHDIEEHLRKVAGETKGQMTYSILRPVAFLDNLTPDLFGRVFATSFRDVLGGKNEKALQLVATSDIGFFAAQAFIKPDEWKGREMALAGDELTYSEFAKIFREETGEDLKHTYSWLAGLIRWMIKDFGVMFTWFRDEGYGADIKMLREMNPGLKDYRAWLREDSVWVKDSKTK
ncbi:NAD(P)-binding protein [Zalerion maritima]|uniref:NAD(P)-binding protein n=1 Tax=Zalerion maritima TaxID=339359 RepID=A0AAD5WP55_9PEZI|nr:NAD(P)-binding protein [Zalerion maritima]